MPVAAAETAMTPVRIVHREEIADDITLFEMKHFSGGELPAFTAGAHIAVRVPNGLVRKYSLCNDPAERDRYAIAVKRESGSCTGGTSGSTSLVDDARAGDEILVSAPRNNFALVKSAAGYLFIAGGIGITPILSMVRHLRGSGAGRFKLTYCTRTPAATAFRDVLSAADLRGVVRIHHDHGDPARSLDLWPLLERPKGVHLYCCGPRPLMQAVRDMTGHWSSSSVHFETFAEPERRAADDRPFQVRLARSGAVVEVPVGITILEALRQHGLDVPSSCESGSCGTCRTRLIAGEADHRDLVRAEHERSDAIMVCVSRARSDEITIDR
jgi:phthalate 4,5-dioxygenase reductase component